MPRFDPLFYPFFAILLLFVPLRWLSSAILAALIHEVCHIITIISLGGSIQEIRISIGSVTIDADIPTPFAELLSAMAGPLGSLSLLLFSQHFPCLALCGAVQGLFNLLPIFPLDGGRILCSFLTLTCPNLAVQITDVIQKLFLILLLVASIWGAFFLSMGAVPVLLTLLLFWKQKNLANRHKSGYNSNTIDKEVLL